MYLIVNCPKCGELMLANDRHKTKGCLKCVKRSPIYTLKVLKRMKYMRGATEIMQKIKMERANAGSDMR